MHATVLESLTLNVITPNPDQFLCILSEWPTSLYSILAKRSLKRPYSVQPIMSKEQQKNESILLKERWNLIQSGVSRTQIRICDTNMYVNKKLHGKVVDSTFMPSNTANSSPIVAPNNQYQLPTMPAANTILSGADTACGATPSQPITSWTKTHNAFLIIV